MSATFGTNCQAPKTMNLIFLELMTRLFVQHHLAMLLCDYQRRNEEWRPSMYSLLYNLMVKGDYMSKA